MVLLTKDERVVTLEEWRDMLLKEAKRDIDAMGITGDEAMQLYTNGVLDMYTGATRITKGENDGQTERI